MSHLLINAIVIAGLTSVGVAQQTGQPALQETAVKLGGKAISLKYSAASTSGRKIFGGVVPYGQIWRVGNGTTAFHTDVDLEVQGLAVPKGDYSFFILPDAKEWRLVISKQTGPQALRYDPKMDLGRVSMDMKKAPSPIQTLRMTLTTLGRVGGKIELAWENTLASVPFNIDVVGQDREW